MGKGLFIQFVVTAKEFNFLFLSLSEDFGCLHNIILSVHICGVFVISMRRN